MIAAAIAVLGTSAVQVSGKGRVVPKVYMFGFAASFTDSTVYFTPVQEVDSAWMDSKTNFLMGRDNYALQLKNMLASKMGKPNRTCIVAFGKNRKAAVNKYQKMLKLYTVKGKGKYDVQYISDSDFHFKTIDMSYEESAPAEKASHNGKKKQANTPLTVRPKK